MAIHKQNLFSSTFISQVIMLCLNATFSLQSGTKRQGIELWKKKSVQDYFALRIWQSSTIKVFPTFQTRFRPQPTYPGWHEHCTSSKPSLSASPFALKAPQTTERAFHIFIMCFYFNWTGFKLCLDVLSRSCGFHIFSLKLTRTDNLWLVELMTQHFPSYIQSQAQW